MTCVYPWPKKSPRGLEVDMADENPGEQSSGSLWLWTLHEGKTYFSSVEIGPAAYGGIIADRIDAAIDALDNIVFGEESDA